MKVLKAIIFAATTAASFYTQSAAAESYRIYCNTLVRLTATTPSWATNQVISKTFTTLNYSFMRDADFAGSDFNQVFRDIQVPSEADALHAAFTALCEPQQKNLIDTLYGMKIPLSASVSQCGYVYLGTNFKVANCRVNYVRVP